VTALLFNDGKWTVTTNSWTVAGKGIDQHNVTLCYGWTPMSGFGFAGNSTGLASIDMGISMSEFTRLLVSKSPGGLLDLRPHQS
jgi:hypothetical protein